MVLVPLMRPVPGLMRSAPTSRVMLFRKVESAALACFARIVSRSAPNLVRVPVMRSVPNPMRGPPTSRVMKLRKAEPATLVCFVRIVSVLNW